MVAAAIANLGNVAQLVRLPPGALVTMTAVMKVAAAVVVAVVRLLGVNVENVATAVVTTKEVIIMVARIITVAKLRQAQRPGINLLPKVAPSQAMVAIPATLVTALLRQEWDRLPVCLPTLLAHLRDFLAILTL